MFTISSLQTVAICLIAVIDPVGGVLYCGSIAVPETSADEIVNLWAKIRAASTPGFAGTNAAYCDVILGSAAGDPWRSLRLDFTGVDWLGTIQLWNRLADGERIVKMQASKLLEQELQAEIS